MCAFHWTPHLHRLVLISNKRDELTGLIDEIVSRNSNAKRLRLNVKRTGAMRRDMYGEKSLCQGGNPAYLPGRLATLHEQSKRAAAIGNRATATGEYEARRQDGYAPRQCCFMRCKPPGKGWF